MKPFPALPPPASFLKKVTVAPNKGCTYILCFGSEPFAKVVKRVKSVLEERVEVIVPHGFRARTKCNGLDWEFETRVVDKDKVEYLCTCVGPYEVEAAWGGWQVTASKAYAMTNEALESLGACAARNYRKENGALLAGVVYENVQHEVRTFFQDRIELFFEEASMQVLGVGDANVAEEELHLPHIVNQVVDSLACHPCLKEEVEEDYLFAVIEPNASDLDIRDLCLPVLNFEFVYQAYEQELAYI